MADTRAFHSTRSGDILTMGFGTTVAMWAVGYVCRLPPAIVPSWMVLLAVLACLVAGGLVTGRLTGRGPRGGVYVGLLASVLNLMVLGSVISGDQPNQIVPSALLWLPGSLLLGALLAGAGAVLASRPPVDAAPRNWTGAFARVAVGATFLLLVAGGIVTGAQAGLDVVDWPNSFGYNMFLYPWSRMTGGIYYEHSHRLLGSLVGLTTLVLAIRLRRTDPRPWLRRLAWLALLAVVVQGILGGLRVTGRFTLSTSPADTSPSITLAVVHGVLGQVFFAMTATIAVATSTTWHRGVPPSPRTRVEADRTLAAVLVGGLLVQLVIGAVLRHTAWGLLIHISLAVLVVLLALLCTLRAWGLYGGQPPLPLMGRVLMLLVLVQVGLGVAALIVVGLTPRDGPPPASDVLLSTAHQAGGAVLLAWAVGLLAWYWRTAAAPGLMVPSSSCPEGL